MEIIGISIQNFTIWAIFGLVIGISAHVLDRKKVSGGLIVTALFGCLGAVTSGYLTSFLLGKAMITFNLEGLLIAAAGALLIALFYRSSFRNETYGRGSIPKERSKIE